MNNHRLLTIIICLLMSGVSYGQMDTYTYQRSLGEISSKWHDIPLYPQILSKLQSDFSDIRIYGILTNGDTIEAPYVLRSSVDKVVNSSWNLEMINSAYQRGRRFITLAMNDTVKVNELNLQFSEKNYDLQVGVEGSNDQLSWYTISENNRVISIRKNDISFEYAKIPIPTSQYRYYRLTIDGEEPPDLQAVFVKYHALIEGEYQRFTVGSAEFSEDDERTNVLISMERTYPVSKVQLVVEDSVDFFRPITISYAEDSLRAEKDFHYRYRMILSSTLHSIDEHGFEFEPQMLSRLKISVENGDNEPLNIKGVFVFGPDYWLTARFDQEAQYFLVYGRKNVYAPAYDIVKFDIPENQPELSAGDEHLINKPDPAPLTIFENKMWLWLVMGLIIVTLAYYSVKMLKDE